MARISLLIQALLGDHQGMSTLALSDVYSSSGSVNLYIDKLGQIRPVDGYTRRNQYPYLTNNPA